MPHWAQPPRAQLGWLMLWWVHAIQKPKLSLSCSLVTRKTGCFNLERMMIVCDRFGPISPFVLRLSQAVHYTYVFSHIADF